MRLPAVVLAVACACHLLVGGVCGLHITWLPLGDSITWGCGNGILPHVDPPGCRATRAHLNECGCERDSGSYRIPVAQALEQWNITATTVGSLTAGPASSPTTWQHHEGHPGWTIEQVHTHTQRDTQTDRHTHTHTQTHRHTHARALGASLRSGRRQTRMSSAFCWAPMIPARRRRPQPLLSGRCSKRSARPSRRRTCSSRASCACRPSTLRLSLSSTPPSQG